MHLVAINKSPEPDIIKDVEQEMGRVHTLTVSVSAQTDAFEQDTEEESNKQYICAGTLTDDIL